LLVIPDWKPLTEFENSSAILLPRLIALLNCLASSAFFILAFDPTLLKKLPSIFCSVFPIAELRILEYLVAFSTAYVRNAFCA
jgi:hypothetical protein